MWTRFCVALGLIFTILAAGMLILRHIEGTCAGIEASLSAALDTAPELGSGPSRDVPSALLDAHAQWERGLPVFCTYVIHDQVDTVGEAFHRALGHYEGGDWGEYRATLRELLFRIDLIAHYDRPTVRSVF